MDSKFFDSLFEGDSANGVKLGMGLTGGDFWPRVGGCQNLYRGASAAVIDFETILSVTDVDTDSITIPATVEHESGASYVYVLRRANGCGREEHTFSAAVKVTFDEDGDLAETACNEVFALKAEQIEGPAVRLIWYYFPLDQQAECDSFNIYWDNGTSEIDYDTELATVDYAGPGYYSFDVEETDAGSYRFCVRTVSNSGLENTHLGTVKIQIRDAAPQSVEALEAQAV